MKDYYKRLYFGQIEDNHILVEEVNRLENNNKVLKDTIDKAIEKLYLWGETLNPTFQKEMLEILGDKENE